MPLKRVIECVCPSLGHRNSADYGGFIQSDRFVIVQFVPLYNNVRCALEKHRQYMLVFNRTARAWSAPLPMPPPYDRTQHLIFEPIGIVHDRTIVAFSQQKSTREISICFFRISQKLDSVTLIESQLPLNIQSSVPNCLGFFRSPDSLQIVYSSYDSPCTLYEHSGTASTLTELPLAGLKCEYAMTHAGILYMLCAREYHDRKLYKYVNGKLELVADCEAFYRRRRRTRGTSGLRLTHLGSRLFFSFWEDRYRNPNVFALDVATCQWTMVRTKLTGQTQSHPGVEARCGEEGELLIGTDPFSGVGNHEYALHSFWLLPAKMSTIALRAVHKSIPRKTKEKLRTEQANVQSTTDLIEFLFRQ